MKRRTSDLPSQFERIRERMEQARRRVIGAPGTPSFSVTFMEPSVDVYETEDEVVIVLEMAGLRDQEIELEVEGPSAHHAANASPPAEARNATIGRWKYATALPT